MPAVPKRKISKARGRNRRGHWRIKRQDLASCPQCGGPVKPYHVCLNCGKYRGAQILEIEEE